MPILLNSDFGILVGKAMFLKIDLFCNRCIWRWNNKQVHCSQATRWYRSRGDGARAGAARAGHDVFIEIICHGKYKFHTE